MASLGVNMGLVDFEPEQLQKTTNDCGMTNRAVKVIPILANLKNDDEIEKAVDDFVKEFGRLDILVNSAGIVRPGSIGIQTMQEFDETFQVNVRAMFFTIKTCIPHLTQSKGVVVNVASVSTSKVLPGMVSYIMAKGAVDMMTKSVALELSDKGIRVNSVKPGTVRTNLLVSGGWSPDALDELYADAPSQFPMGRIGKPEEIADAICFLASDEASWITGQELVVDGGFSAGHVWNQEKK